MHHQWHKICCSHNRGTPGHQWRVKGCKRLSGSSHTPDEKIVTCGEDGRVVDC